MAIQYRAYLKERMSLFLSFFFISLFLLTMIDEIDKPRGQVSP